MTYVGTLQKALDKLAEEGKSVGLVIHPGKTSNGIGRQPPCSIKAPWSSPDSSEFRLRWGKQQNVGVAQAYRQLQCFVFSNPEIREAILAMSLTEGQRVI